jgi:hypothetical protein
MLKLISRNLLLLAIVLIACGCSEDFVDNPHPNQPPETFTSIFTEQELNPTISRQTIHWWGDDPDGLVVGFIYTFKESAANVTTWSNDTPDPDWTFTTETEQTFTLQLSGDDTTYTFRVKSIDDQGAADPTPALQQFPIINSKPSVEFPVGTDVPDTTFTVASFNWRGADPDGDDTISKYQYVLDDTTNESAWRDLGPTASSIILLAADGLTQGRHVFYLRAVDVAGAVSNIARMPRDENDVWFVREPKSTFLVIDDYNIADNTANFYHTTLQAIVGTFDVWDIKSNGNALEPPSSQAFTLTLLLFERIFWYADTDPNLEKAQVGIPTFLNRGGKLIMTTSFKEFSSNQGDPLDFSPVDSLGARIARITRNQLVQATPDFAATGFPNLSVGVTIIPNVFPLVPKVSARVMYVLPENPSQWPGTPAMAVLDATSSFAFFGLPIASLNGLGTAAQVIEKILTDIF